MVTDDWWDRDTKGWLDLLHRDFWIIDSREITVDPQGLIIRAEHVENRNTNLREIPVPFLRVYGNFKVSAKLTSLENSPREVTGSFDVSDNQLTSLVGGPTTVGVDYLCMYNKLENLVGAPDHVSRYMHVHQNPLTSLQALPDGIGYFTVTNSVQKDLPLLRCLTVQGRVAVVDPQKIHWDEQLTDIMNDPQWHGKGKQGMLNCALALKKAGYQGNARW